MIDLHPDKARKIVAAARLLESDKPGERQAAAEAMARLSSGEGLTVADLIERGLAVTNQPRPDPVLSPSLLRNWQRWAMEVLAMQAAFDAAELDFARRMFAQRKSPSMKQLSWIKRLAERARSGR